MGLMSLMTIPRLADTLTSIGHLVLSEQCPSMIRLQDECAVKIER